MDDLVFHLDENDHLALAVAGLLVSILMWRWTASRFTGFVADELRLLVLVFLTAWFPPIFLHPFTLFWILAFSGITSMWVALGIYFAIWWFVFSITFFWLRRLHREMSLK